MKSAFAWFRNRNRSQSRRFFAGSIRRKQLAAFLAVALIPLVVLGVVLYFIAADNLLDHAAVQLSGIRKLKHNMVQDYFSERRQDIEQLADALSQLYAAGYDKIHAVENKDKGASEIELTHAIQAAISPVTEGESSDSIRHYRQQSGFENVFLVSTSGYVFHAANHGSDRYTNLLTGPYKNTNLGRLIAKVLESKSFGMADFEAYMPIQNAPAAFMALPVSYAGDVKFILAVQLSISQINAVAEERTGLGKTGETYFVGKDNMLRNDSYRLKELKVMNTILSPEYKVDTEASLSALKGNSGTKIIKNYLNIVTLSSWQPITIAEPNAVNPEGIHWALITEIEEREVNQPLATLRLIMAGALGGTVLLVVLSALLLSDNLTRQIRHIMALLNEIGTGNYHARCSVVSRDELGTMAHSLNAMLDDTLNLIQSREERDNMQNAIMKLLMDISALTQGDLTIRAEVTEDMTGAIADSFNSMAEQLSLLVSNVKQSTLEVTTTSQQVTKTTIELSRTSDEHATQIKGVVKAIEEMSKSMHVVSQHAVQSATVSDQAKQNAVSGAEAVRRTNTAMNSIRQRVQEAARAIKRLGESSQEIGHIVQIINDIADRTSILALNASIQAAMAGDAGRGFAVVADEVQRLAEQSTSSTKQIETLVNTIQSEINEAGARMEDSIEQVLHGTELANGAHNKLEEIEAVSTQLADLVKAISKAANEQAESSEIISATMKKVGETTSQASVQGKLTALSIANLADTSKNLRESVEAFKLEDDPADDIDADLDIISPIEEKRPSPEDEDLDVLYEVG
ncbi:MAG: HAMP domain-containing methyl-accepting chemotaxis protein [Desulfobacteraceae bacterium]|jgi:methyl-accepting chemotaxis protein